MALPGTAAPSERQQGRVPYYEPESENRTMNSEKRNRRSKQGGGSGPHVGRPRKQHARSIKDRSTHILAAVATDNMRTPAVKKNG